MKPILAILVCLPFLAASPRFDWRPGGYQMHWKYVSTVWEGEWSPAEQRAVAEELNRVLCAPVYVGDQPGKPRVNLIVRRVNQDLPGCAFVNPSGVSRITVATRILGTGNIRDIANHEAMHLKGWVH